VNNFTWRREKNATNEGVLRKLQEPAVIGLGGEVQVGLEQLRREQARGEAEFSAVKTRNRLVFILGRL
jgi:hypothetical protein